LKGTVSSESLAKGNSYNRGNQCGVSSCGASVKVVDSSLQSSSLEAVIECSGVGDSLFLACSILLLIRWLAAEGKGIWVDGRLGVGVHASESPFDVAYEFSLIFEVVTRFAPSCPTEGQFRECVGFGAEESAYESSKLGVSSTKSRVTFQM
jgi:hypothetical protein